MINYFFYLGSTDISDSHVKLPSWNVSYFEKQELIKVDALHLLFCSYVSWSGLLVSTVDGRNPTNQLLGSLSHYLERLYIPGGQLDFLSINSSICLSCFFSENNLQDELQGPSLWLSTLLVLITFFQFIIAMLSAYLDPPRVSNFTFQVRGLNFRPGRIQS